MKGSIQNIFFYPFTIEYFEKTFSLYGKML